MGNVIIIVKESDQEYRSRMWQEYQDSLPKFGTKEYIAWRAAEKERILASIIPYSWFGQLMEDLLLWLDRRKGNWKSNGRS